MIQYLTIVKAFFYTFPIFSPLAFQSLSRHPCKLDILIISQPTLLKFFCPFYSSNITVKVWHAIPPLSSPPWKHRQIVVNKVQVLLDSSLGILWFCKLSYDCSLDWSFSWLPCYYWRLLMPSRSLSCSEWTASIFLIFLSNLEFYMSEFSTCELMFSPCDLSQSTFPDHLKDMQGLLSKQPCNSKPKYEKLIKSVCVCACVCTCCYILFTVKLWQVFTYHRSIFVDTHYFNTYTQRIFSSYFFTMF